MFYLRPGSILDLSIIASENHITDAAKFFDIPNSTLAAYISGTRFLRPSAVWGMGIRWGKYMEHFLLPYFDEEFKKRTLDDTISSRIDIQTTREKTKKDFIEEESWSLLFSDNYDMEFTLRKIVEFKPWQKPFGCCAAQVLAHFEATNADPDKLTSFDKEKALMLLKFLFPVGIVLTPDSRIQMLDLAFNYLIWRIKTKDYYTMDIFNSKPRNIEVRDNRLIPLLDKDEYLYYIPDNYLQYDGMDMQDVPSLKKAATLDVLMLCRSVEIKVSNYGDDIINQQIYCKCTSPTNEEISFMANM